MYLCFVIPQINIPGLKLRLLESPGKPNKLFQENNSKQFKIINDKAIRHISQRNVKVNFASNELHKRPFVNIRRLD